MKKNKPKECRLCGASSENLYIQGEYVFGGTDEHKFWRCHVCDAVFLYPVPSEEEEKLFYKMEFEKYMSSRVGGDRDWTSARAHVDTNNDQVKRRNGYLKDYLKSGQDLLEIGCSSGFMMDSFRDAGLNCTGIEPSGVFADFVRQNGFDVYESLDGFRREMPNKKFDVITHFFVLEHIRDPFSFFKESVSLLKEKGIIIAEIPCVNDPLTSLYSIPAFEKFYWSIAHHYYYSPKSLEYLMSKLRLSYKLIPEQRYDLSNHIVWMTEGRPGGQGKFDDVFSTELRYRYMEDLKKNWKCDTAVLVIGK